MFLFNGCVSSEETGAADRASTPVQILGPIDTTRYIVRRDHTTRTNIDTVKKVTVKPRKTAPNFKSKQDTVRASLVTKSKLRSMAGIKIERPENPFFTVQIGAFSKATNALRAQKKAKERFVDEPVFNNYVKVANIYRVSIGRYIDQKKAFQLRDNLKQKYPHEYLSCWINYIP